MKKKLLSGEGRRCAYKAGIGPLHQPIFGYLGVVPTLLEPHCTRFLVVLIAAR